MTEKLLTAEQAAAILQVHPRTVKRMAASGEIPAMKIGKLWRFRESLLDAWVNSEVESTGRSRPQMGETQYENAI